ncbi:MAG TPA: histidine phosphatase family protein [Rhodoglobus sp.]|nr:histidine phosphatase family protein [Rhodoglobus sp.]
MLLYLVRHGETDWNRDHRIQGLSDIPLNDTGRQQAAATGRLLARRRWDAVVTSPLSRAFETGSIIARELGLPSPSTDAALVERNYGEAEGLDWEEVRRRFPDEARVPGRETRRQVADRVLPALLAIARAHDDEAVVVVTHGGVIRTLLNELEPGNGYEAITNGSVHSFRYADGALSLIAFDDPIEELSEQGEPLVAQNPAEA